MTTNNAINKSIDGGTVANSTLTGNTITTGTINNTPIGQTTHVAGRFTNLRYDQLNPANNVTAGLVALVSGTIVVNTAAIDTNSIVFLTGGTGVRGNYTEFRADRVVGVSFRIVSSLATDDANVAWMIVEPV